eukprot:XP_001702906.1 predicted protein [Chlamydomonas reinhardtii]
MSQSIDGHPLAGIERSSHLEEYSRTRPASAGGRPRSLLNKVANAAAAAQVEDEPDPVDAEPWVLEGWGDGPSVSEAAQQAALKLAPHLKNVPTTLVGLGGGPGGGRRVLSAGPGGRSNQLKASEARRKPPSGASPQTQGDRRASGSQNPVPAGVGHGGTHATATIRRATVPPPRNLEVGDESDVEPSMPAPAAARPVAGASTMAQGRPVGKYGSRGDPGLNSGGFPRLPCSSSFTSPGKPPVGASGAASSEHDDMVANLAPIAPPPPQLPGLFLTGRKGASFRNDGLGLSGWDPEAPAFQHPGSPSAAGGSGGGGAGQNVSLWIGPTAPGFGIAAPQQDSLSDFAARRQDISSAGSNGGAAAAEPQKQAPPRGGTYTGLLPPTSATMPMRVTSLGVKPSPVPRP